jgi:hypothetical protein
MTKQESAILILFVSRIIIVPTVFVVFILILLLKGFSIIFKKISKIIDFLLDQCYEIDDTLLVVDRFLEKNAHK